MSITTVKFSYIGSKTVKYTVELADGTLRKAADGTYAANTTGNWSGALHTATETASGSPIYVANLGALDPAVPEDDQVTVHFYDCTGSDVAFGSAEYGSGGGIWDGTGFVDPAAAAILEDPSNKLATDGDGQVTANNAVADGESLVVAPVGGEILFTGTPGQNVSVAIYDSSGLVKRGSNYEAWDDAHIAEYRSVNLTDIGGGVYVGDFPAEDADKYRIRARYWDGVAWTTGDMLIAGVQEITWDGSRAVIPRNVAASELADDVAAALAAGVNLLIHAPATGSTLDLYQGDAYLVGEETDITITKQANETHWPATLESVHFWAVPTAEMLELDADAASLSEIACTVVTAEGDSQAFRFELDAEQTASLSVVSKLPNAGYTFWFRANVAGNPKTLRKGPLTIHPQP